MQNISDILTKILGNLNAKYNHYNNIYNLTKQMEEVIVVNDEYSLSALLDMRGKAMAVVDKIDSDNKKLINILPVGLKSKIEQILFKKESVTLDNPIETNIFDTNKRNLVLLNKIIVLDKKVKTRMKR